jgi:lipopolysaccharide/colanic/teichoic acid biosynthesis glycosyltransferase
MVAVEGVTTTVTSADDSRITKLGAWLRKTKIDELPQLINVFLGQMSLVGPRPDVPGWADALTGEDAVILEMRPGITGPASLHFRNEEELLGKEKDPEVFNRDVIWPEKVAVNRNYYYSQSTLSDFRWLFRTFFPYNR